MKARNRITMIFTLLTCSLMASVFGFIYYFSFRYTENEFYERLRERTNIVAQSHLEKDELSSRIYNEIRRKHFQTLPEEREALFRVNSVEQKIIKADSIGIFPGHFLTDIFDNKYAQTKDQGIYYTGILYADNEGEFIVAASAKDLYGQAKMSNLKNILAIALLLCITVVFIIGRFYAGKVLEPITKITVRANEITATNLHLRLDTGKNKDELSELSITFNNMLDRLETAFEMQTGFVNNASHEFKNPLAGILAATDVILQHDRSVEEYKSTLLVIEKEAHRLDLLVSNLLKLAQAGGNDNGLFMDAVRTDELILGVKESIDAMYPENKVILDFTRLPSQSEALIVQGNQGLLKIALTNIVDNACKFSMGKIVDVGLSVTKDSVEIFVKDQGVGIPQNDLKGIIEPFFRASNARGFKGFGIGLSLAQKIIKLHGGSLKIFSRESKGTQINISLPCNNF